MDESTFKHEMIKAETFHDLERPEYWAGYMRGLRRRYYGVTFGTEEEHKIWMTADGDETRRQRSQGYRDGFLLGIETKTLTIRLPADLWRRVKMMQLDGKIKSINQAAIDGLEIIAKEKG